VVLSGTGSDGSQGARAVKSEGGIVVAQTPESAEYDGMPHNAISTGVVDYVLPPEEMPAQLISYLLHGGGKPPGTGLPHTPSDEEAIRKTFVLLRSHTGHDFSQYKESTTHRRIERRMAVHQIGKVDRYLRYLQNTPAEVDALFHDLLIGVTSFFRDRAAFEVLETQVIPKLFVGKTAGTPVRVWVAGCSTGEEAYSIAILIQERADKLNVAVKGQVFATDIDGRAIEHARHGVYPVGAVADVSPERLARYFVAESTAGDAFRVRGVIRDMLIFSEHDVLRDPPFSKIDLVSCRNLLIYLGSALQKKVFPLLHYALNPGGFLFLGNSESAGESSDLFSPLSSKERIYQRREVSPYAWRRTTSDPLGPTVEDRGLHQSFRPPRADPKISLREVIDQALLQRYAPVSALVNGQGDVLYLHGRTGPYLELAPGEPGINVLKMAREGLRYPLTAALHRVVGTNETVRQTGLQVKTSVGLTSVNLTVFRVSSLPGRESATALYLICFEEMPVVAPSSFKQVPEEPASETIQESPATDSKMAALKNELRAKEEYLAATNEELQTTNEKLTSTNEELQSVNEELQSTNEELETSKEELQSMNEELGTVNAELQQKVADLSRANNDVNNLLSSTGVGTVFVDCQLCVQRFTPAATLVFNLIPGDIGRPVNHIVSNLVGYGRLVEDLQEVLDDLVSKEVEVQTKAGAWYSLRLRPYRTLENVIEGAVVASFDITELKRARDAQRESEALRRLAVVVRDSPAAIIVHDGAGRVLAWNPAAERMYGFTESEALAKNLKDLAPEAEREEALALARLSRSEVPPPYRTRRICKDGRVREVWASASALVDGAGEPYATATTEWQVEPDEHAKTRGVETGASDHG